MTATSDPRLSGAGLVPLPYESTCSLLLRLAYLNRMQLSDFSALGLTYSDADRRPVILNPAGVGRLYRLTGWSPDWREAWTFQQLRDTQLVDNAFRFCPQCLADGYHTFLFQLPVIQACPKHGTSLVSHCKSCGHALGLCCPRAFTRQDPLRCAACHAGICKPLPTIATYCQAQKGRDDISLSFSPCWIWIKRIVAKRRYFHALLRADLGRSPRAVDFARQRSLFCTMEPSPLTPAPLRLTILPWCLSGCPDIDPDCRPNRARLTVAYQSTLRQLQQWLLATCCHSHANLERSSQWTGQARLGYGDLDCSLFSAEESAYMLLRYSVERSYVDRSINSNVKLAVPWHGFAISESTLQACPLLPLRAIFLGMYAESYVRVKGRCSIAPALDGVRSDAELVMCAEKSADICWGFVAFPTIDGMPLAPFHLSELTDGRAMSWLVSEIRRRQADAKS